MRHGTWALSYQVDRVCKLKLKRRGVVVVQVCTLSSFSAPMEMVRGEYGLDGKVLVRIRFHDSK